MARWRSPAKLGAIRPPNTRARRRPAVERDVDHHALLSHTTQPDTTKQSITSSSAPYQCQASPIHRTVAVHRDSSMLNRIARRRPPTEQRCSPVHPHQPQTRVRRHPLADRAASRPNLSARRRPCADQSEDCSPSRRSLTQPYGQAAPVCSPQSDHRATPHPSSTARRRPFADQSADHRAAPHPSSTARQRPFVDRSADHRAAPHPSLQRNT